MLKGINISLMIGPVIPIAVSTDEIEALTSVEVSAGTGRPGAFRLEFRVSARSSLHTKFLAGGLGVPLLRVVVAATVNGQPAVLIDGVMTEHQTSPGLNGLSTLSIIGEDLTQLMDFQDWSGLPFPAMPAFARVALILAKYSPLGVIPKVVPNISTFGPNPIDSVPTQKGTDLQYIKLLAQRAGYEFYLEPGPVAGTSMAYWGPTIKFGQAQPALTMNMDAANNVESLSFQFKNTRAALPIAMIQDENSKIPIPIPVGNISPLNPPLGLLSPIPNKIVRLKNTAKLKFAEALEAALVRSSKGTNCVTANGTLDVVRYGRLLEPRKLVSVRGAGLAYDGLYYVESVTHKIKPGEYKQDFTLSRNGLVSTVERVSA